MSAAAGATKAVAPYRPSLAELEVYGVLNALEGHHLFDEFRGGGAEDGEAEDHEERAVTKRRLHLWMQAMDEALAARERSRATGRRQE